MPMYRLSFKNQPDLIVEAVDPLHAPLIAKMIHELDGLPDETLVTKIVPVTNLRQLFMQ